MEFICSNCDAKQSVKIKKGMSVSKFMGTKKAECKCCGIKALHTYEDYLMKKKMWEQKLIMFSSWVPLCFLGLDSYVS